MQASADAHLLQRTSSRRGNKLIIQIVIDMLIFIECFLWTDKNDKFFSWFIITQVLRFIVNITTFSKANVY